jgi:hypothetical protein
MERIAVLSVPYRSAIVLLNSELPSNKCLILLHAVGVNSTRICSAVVLRSNGRAAFHSSVRACMASGRCG